ncbi:23S rRNA (cytosine1962-C5)-methyltransferase [Marchantia polymorpha subsp. ruderalis]
MLRHLRPVNLGLRSPSEEIWRNAFRAPWSGANSRRSCALHVMARNARNEGGGDASSSSPRIAEGAARNPGVPRVVLKKGKVQMFKDGSPMVYSGAVDCVVGKPPPRSGETVLVTDAAKQPFAWGVYNQDSMFRVRIMQMEADAERDPSCFLDMEKLIFSRVAAAVELRKLLGLPSCDTNVFRLINSEGDGLSGLIADVLGEHLVVASSAAWVEKYRPTIEAALTAATGGIASITWRPSVDILKDEGLSLQDPTDFLIDLPGELDEVEVVENGVRFMASVSGQKTGFYADQRESRFFLRSLCEGKTVLDLCCYSGGFALNAAAGGASHVTGVDSSGPAIELARANAALNGIDPCRSTFIRQDIKNFLSHSVAEGRSWDVVILDPPKLAPNRKVLSRAITQYRRLNALAMKVINPSGLLMTCSCSGAMTQSGNFVSVLQEASKQAGRKLTQLRYAGASPDHTLDVSYPEGAYLTNVLLRVL